MGTFLYTILVYPLEMFVEFVYAFFYKGFKNPGLSIAAISVIVNLLALPLYNIAESLQKKERDERLRLQPGISRIKAAFKGDEQYMMLSTFYKQNHYHPAYALRSSISLIIQVPFFIAAYHFLSHLQQLQGQSFLFIPNLGAPDGFLSFGEISINLLPIVMTLINVIAGAIYTKGFPLRDKVQLYGMAGLFLVLLYTSPAGLVLYWTLNNVFSLVKNIFYKLKQPLKVSYFIATFGTLALATAMWIGHPTLTDSERILLVGGVLFVAFLPLLLWIVTISYNQFLAKFAENRKQRNLIFLLSGLLLFLINGVVIPANLIASSTIEFSYVGTVDNPLFYVGNTASIFFGLWVVWSGFIYAMGKKKMKAIFSFLLCILSLTALVNLFVFKGNYGLVSRLLQFDDASFLTADKVFVVAPFAVIAIICVVCLVLLNWNKAHYLSTLLIILTLTAAVSGLVSCFTIQSEYKAHQKNVLERNALFDEAAEIKPVFHLSKTGKNVVYIFLDRAFNFYFPYIYEQFPEMQQQFKGFVYYPNTISFGRNTLLGSPAMMGGYEYSPEAMNARPSEKLVDKHNEASLVLPKLFLDNGYSVTITDPPYCNYKWEGDYTPFDQYPEMQVMQHKGKFSINYKDEFSDVLSWNKEYESTIITKRLPLFSILKTTLPIVRRTLYEKGGYFLAFGNSQNTEEFIDPYAQLHYLKNLTDFEAEGNTYTFISNDTPHQPMFLQAPKYEPQTVVTDRSTPLDDNPGMRDVDIHHYHANAASLRQVGLWFASLQEAGVYDNTRIIIVGDHGYDLYSTYFDGFSKNMYEYSTFNPLLLFKDFGATGEYVVDNSFMVNADAAVFAARDLGFAEINPFTGNDLTKMVDKKNPILYTGPGDPSHISGNIFSHDVFRRYSIHDSIFEESNWSSIGNQETK
ncbi:membrane protein insertase YidC [Sphaerochaeta sp. PS]|uniref:membrane protein insertase YidC n=1 Tax=Sphaerochaeta sp. PS TaxID=3076336 RepID=UPI0028A521F7|nr:membrane protein insertase YidC [Sphaerochaeta sp. PS]MDT4762164.1 membrane protein insertase YidC [Sphaerochaeta sp. PS]